LLKHAEMSDKNYATGSVKQFSVKSTSLFSAGMGSNVILNIFADIP